VLGCLALRAIVSCGGEVAPEPEVPGTAKSGTRLKLVYWESEDGFRAAQGELFDTGLDAPCLPSIVGRDYRCVPTNAASGGRVFADSACTSPLFLGYGSAPPRYDLEGSRPIESGEACEAKEPKLYSILDRTALTSYFTQQDGTCVEKALGKDQVLYGLREGAVSWMAELRLLEESTPERLHRRTWAGADGVRLPARPLDSAYGTECYVYGQICIPFDNLEAHERYQDASCTKRVVATSGTCGKPKIMRVKVGLCKTESYAVGEAVTEAAPWSWTGATCREDSPTSPERSERLFAIGRRVLPESAILNRVHDVTAHTRLRSYDSVDEAGRSFRQSAPMFTDTVGGFDCAMAPWSSAAAACLPGSPRVEHRYFRDPDCKERLEVVAVDTNPCSEVPETAYEAPELGSPAAEARVGIRPIGESFDGPVYEGPDCRSSHPSGKAFRVLEPEVSRVPVAFVKRVVDR
jgi:hypothetical protein